jgi:hypothetical protein
MKRAIAASFEELEHHMCTRTDITHTPRIPFKKTGCLLIKIYVGGCVKLKVKFIKLSNNEKKSE